MCQPVAHILLVLHFPPLGWKTAVLTQVGEFCRHMSGVSGSVTDIVHSTAGVTTELGVGLLLRATAEETEARRAEVTPPWSQVDGNTTQE